MTPTRHGTLDSSRNYNDDILISEGTDGPDRIYVTTLSPL